MPSWSFWDWLTYICIGVAALVLALDQAIKGSPQLLGNLSGLLAKPSWNYAPLALIGLSGVLILLKQFGIVGAKDANHNVELAAQNPDIKYIKTGLRLQFFGDH